MGAVSYGQGGYVGASMSVRAQAAYERGLDDLLEAKRDEAELSEDLGLVRESDCR